MIQELERFIIIVEEGSFTKAAQRLFLTQPALSQSIARLEKEIGVSLIKRTGKRVVVTEDGQMVYTLALHIQKLWLKAKDPKIRNHGLAQVYSIGLFDNAALKLASFFKEHFAKQNTRFEITIDRSESLLRGMQQGLFDVCICVLPIVQNWGKDNVLVKKFSEKLYPVSGNLWEKNKREVPYILYNKDSSTRQYIDATFLQHGIKPNVIVESTDPNFMKELAIAGLGVAFLPKNVIEQELEQKKLLVQRIPFLFQRECGVFLQKESNLQVSDLIVREILNNLSSA